MLPVHLAAAAAHSTPLSHMLKLHTTPVELAAPLLTARNDPCSCCSSCTGGKTEDFVAAAKLMHKAGQQVKVPTYLVPATQKVWMDVYALPVPGCDGKTAAQIFQDAGCDTPASPSCAACLGGPKDTYARMNKPEVCVSTTNRPAVAAMVQSCLHIVASADGLRHAAATATSLVTTVPSKQSWHSLCHLRLSPY